MSRKLKLAVGGMLLLLFMSSALIWAESNPTVVVVPQIVPLPTVLPPIILLRKGEDSDAKKIVILRGEDSD